MSPSSFSSIKRSAVVLLLLLISAPGASAQFLLPIPVSVEVRAGAGIPTGDFANREPGIQAESGLMVGAGAAVHISRRFALFGGYSRTRFGCPRCGEQGLDADVTDTGGDFGLQVILPASIRGLGPWIRAGGVYHQISFSGTQGELSSDPALGFEVGGGISLSLLRVIRLTPGVRYRTYSAELDLGGLGEETVDVSHVLVDVGLSYRF